MKILLGRKKKEEKREDTREDLSMNFIIDSELVKRTLEGILKPKHKYYIKDKIILLHRKDLNPDNLVKFYFSLPQGIIKNWIIDIYDTEAEFLWKVILWDRKKKSLRAT